MNETKLVSTVLHRLSYGELFELCWAIIQTIAALMIRVPRLQSRYDTYKAVFDAYDNGFKKALTAPETEELKNFDNQRKGVFILLEDSVRKNAHYAVIPEVQAAAKGLLPIFNNYAGTPKIEYEAETAAIVNLLQELNKPENVARIARLGQTENVTVLEQINTDFQTFYQTRLKNRYDFKQEGTTRQRAKHLIDELIIFGRTVDGLILSASDPDEIAALNEIIANINAIMEQFTIIVHRRIGVKSKKKEDDKKDDGTQKPDNTKPVAPGTPGTPEDPQKPDATNPPAPDTPNQNPGMGPHPLDPNEHPAMGEM